MGRFQTQSSLHLTSGVHTEKSMEFAPALTLVFMLKEREIVSVFTFKLESTVMLKLTSKYTKAE